MAFLLTDGSWLPIRPLMTLMKVSVGSREFTYKGRENKSVGNSQSI